MFREHQLLLFRDPNVTSRQQVALIEALGLVPDVWKDGQQHGLLSNTRPEAPNFGKHNPYLYHSDLTWAPQPIAAISLYGLVLPDVPAPTDFANGIAAARALPSSVRKQIEGCEGLFLIDFDGGDTRYSDETASADAPRARRPVLYPEPISGETSLIIDQLFMDKIVGWERAASEEIREIAHDHLYAAHNVYRHHWKVGDLVVWNNLSLQHGRPQMPTDQERTHRRVSGSHAEGHVNWEASTHDG